MPDAEADLLIAECYTYDRRVRFHLDYRTLEEKLPLFDAKRVVLTHMSIEMIEKAGERGEFQMATDGLEIPLD